MNPAWSVIAFTTLAGGAQGLVVLLAAATLAGAAPPAAQLAGALAVAVGLLLLGLGASFLHLGRPERAWRAAAMWRTSWLSREVIVLPAFAGCVALWAALAQQGSGLSVVAGPALAGLSLAGALLLWWCTGKIYACLRFVQEWAHPLTMLTLAATGLATGALLAGSLLALGVLGLPSAGAREAGAVAVLLLGLAWALRGLALRRNAGLRPRSTLQSATGIAGTRVVQLSMGFTGGSFNTREFFHHAGALVVRRVRWALHGLCYGAPLLLALAVAAGAAPLWLLVALLLHAPGLAADRWLFFAQARHPQNLYYQVVA